MLKAKNWKTYFLFSYCWYYLKSLSQMKSLYL